MRLTIEATDQVVLIDGQPARLWKGTSEHGTACDVYVCAIRVVEGDAAEFDAAARDGRILATAERQVRGA